MKWLYLRLEKLCKDGGRKVPVRLRENVVEFLYNSSVSSLECHLELSIQQTNSGQWSKYFDKDLLFKIFCLKGFFVYFSHLKLGSSYTGECGEEYVQFGRDIMFITSYR